MNGNRFSLRKGLVLVAFGVVLYSVLQNMNAVVGGVGYLWGIFSPVVLGLCMAFVLNVLMSTCECFVMRIYRMCAKKKKKGSGRVREGKKPKFVRAVSLILTLVIAVGIIALTVGVIVPKVSEAIGLFVSNIEQSSSQLSDILGKLLAAFGIEGEAVANLRSTIKGMAEEAMGWIGQRGGLIAGYAIDVTSSLLGTAMDVLFGLIVAIYVLLDKERIGRFMTAIIEHFLPARVCTQILRVCRISYGTFSNFVRGQFLEAVVLGVLCFVGMLIFRFPYAAVISLLIGVTALIPVVGAWIGGAISALLVLLVSPIKALLLVVFILVLQQLEGNLIYPRVVGSSIGLPGILVLTAVIIGQGLMGVAGILLSVPLTAVLYTILKEEVFGAKSAFSENNQEL